MALLGARFHNWDRRIINKNYYVSMIPVPNKPVCVSVVVKHHVTFVSMVVVVVMTTIYKCVCDDDDDDDDDDDVCVCVMS